MNQIVYFDNAATTFPKPEEVYIFMDKFYRQYGANAGRGQHTLSNKANIIVKETRKLILKLFNCPNKKVVFTSSATESINIVLQGLKWDNDLNVYITPFEHNAVLRVLHHIRKHYKINIEKLHVDKEKLDYDLEKIRYQFQDKHPNLVIMSHASNVCGLVTPVKEICDLSNNYGAINVIDMAQTAGLLNLNLNEIKADYVIFAGHKTLYGPFGIGGIVLDEDANIKPLKYGGTGIDSANLDLPQSIPEKFEVGSLNVHAIAGLNAALKWIYKVGVDEIYNKEIQNVNKLLNIIYGFRNIKPVGIKYPKKHIGVISCVFDGLSCDNIGQILNDKGIAVRTGLHCSPEAHRFLGTFPSGTVRFSVSFFNSENDFEHLKKVFQYIEDNS